ncbi:hypothetical protein IAC76_05955 [Spirochaetes bacterium]|uniref:Tetratricopeptide repeat protein n=1 Tax=Candidatus Scatousia excrementipullorum TaxID=2840936 RepID=A0A9D9DNE5_9BACT|nr:hypothetical protein [Candidatus Scatousia excrementipullorum]
MSIALAEQYEENGEYEKALDEYKKSYESNSKDLSLLERLGSLSVMLDKKDDAELYYNKMLELDATNVMAYEQLMDIYVTTDKFKYYIYRGNLHSVSHQYEHAINDYKKALNFCHENHEAQVTTRFVLGTLFEQTGNTTKAIDEYLKILDIDHTQPEVYIRLANMYLTEDVPGSAIETLERAINDGCENDTIREQLSRIYLRNNQPEKAKETTKDELFKIKCMIIAGERDEAFKELSKVEAKYKDNPELYALKAQYYYEEKDYDKALENVLEYNKRQPNTPVGFQMSALIYEGKKDDYNAALNWGKYNLSRGNKDVAINEFLNAYQLKDDDANLLQTLATLLESTGEKHHAMEFYEKLQKLEPANRTALQKLADYRESIGDYRTQADYLEQLLETDKRNLNLIKQLGQLQEKLKNKPEAVKYYKRYLEIAQQGADFDKIQAKLAKLENTEMVQEEGLIDKIMRFFNKD